jgi:hypothetical protein
MISRVKQQLGGSDLHNSAANTPWGYLSSSRARSPIEIHLLCVVYATPASLAPCSCPARRNRHFTYVYNVPLQAQSPPPFAVSDSVQSHDDKSDSTADFRSPICLRPARNAPVNQWAPLFQALIAFAIAARASLRLHAKLAHMYTVVPRGNKFHSWSDRMNRQGWHRSHVMNPITWRSYVCEINRDSESGFGINRAWACEINNYTYIYIYIYIYIYMISHYMRNE